MSLTDPTLSPTVQHSFDDIKKQIHQVLTPHRQLTPAQAHNISEHIHFLLLVQSALHDNQQIKIEVYIADICTHIHRSDILNVPVLDTVRDTLAILTGDPVLMEKVNKFFNKIAKQLDRIDVILKVMNLTSVLMRKEENNTLFKTTMSTIFK